MNNREEPAAIRMVADMLGVLDKLATEVAKERSYSVDLVITSPQDAADTDPARELLRGRTQAIVSYLLQQASTRRTSPCSRRECNKTTTGTLHHFPIAIGG